MILKETLQQIIEAQQKDLKSLNYGVPRTLNSDINLALPFAIIISGIRRCGKSTLMRQIMSSTNGKYYFNFEDPKATSFELNDFQKLDELFQEKFGSDNCYFFDEIQNVEKWELFIRAILDRGKHCLITSSNASLLSKELGTRLTGRHLRQELFPFSYNEFLTFTSAKAGPETLIEYLKKGGFPEYIQFDRSEILQKLLNDIIMRDIVVRHKLRSPKTIKELALYLISNVGVDFSYNNLAKIFNIGSTNSVVSFVSYLEDCYLLFTVPKFSYSLKKQSVNPKKIYVIDNGLAAVSSISFSSNKGRMLENAVFLALRRSGKNIFYFKEEKECDFILKKANKITQAIQVCYSLTETNKNREIDGLINALETFDLPEGLILTFNQQETLKIGEKYIKIVPAWQWLKSDIL
jgi:predicted AAA+ superfamily ATPase